MPPSQQICRWFDDGDIILIANGKDSSDNDTEVLFRVHAVMLGVSSAVFKDMLRMPQPDDAEKLHGCPVVRLSDRGNDVETFINAIYDGLYVTGSYFLNISQIISWWQHDAQERFELRREPSHHMCPAHGVLANLKDSIIQMLQEQWSCDYSKYLLVQHGLRELRHSEAIQIIRVSLELDILHLLPAAFFELETSPPSLWSAADLACLDSISPADLRPIIIGKDKQDVRLRGFAALYDEYHRYERCQHPAATGTHDTSGSCSEKIRQRLWYGEYPGCPRAWSIRKLDYETLAVDEGACEPCSQVCLGTLKETQRAMWDNLRSDFDIREPGTIEF